MEQITPETLRNWLEDSEVYVLDVRSPQTWEASRVKIPGAHHFDPHQPLAAWVENIPKNKKIVAY